MGPVDVVLLLIWNQLFPRYIFCTWRGSSPIRSCNAVISDRVSERKDSGEWTRKRLFRPAEKGKINQRTEKPFQSTDRAAGKPERVGRVRIRWVLAIEQLRWLVKCRFVAAAVARQRWLWLPVKSLPNWIPPRRRRTCTMMTNELIEEEWPLEIRFDWSWFLFFGWLEFLYWPCLVLHCPSTQSPRYGREAYADPYSMGHGVGPVPGGYGVRRTKRRRRRRGRTIIVIPGERI